MTWKRRSTRTSAYLDVELDQFDDDQLLQGLIDSRLITEQEAAAILARGKVNQTVASALFRDPVAGDELSVALHELIVGRRHEAMIHLERALGRDWTGRLTP